MIQIANFRGKGFVSQSIEILTYSKYSHTAALFTEDMTVKLDGIDHHISAGSVIEAWAGGVRLVSSLSAQHTPGTPVDITVFKHPLSAHEEQLVAQCLLRHALNKTKYAYWNVLRFVPVVRLVMPKPLPFSYTRSHVYCTELIMESFGKAGRWLLERCEAWEVPPRDAPRSPLVMFDRTVVTD